MIRSVCTTEVDCEVTSRDRRARRSRMLVIERTYDSEIVKISIPSGPTTKRTITIDISASKLATALQRKVTP